MRPPSPLATDGRPILVSSAVPDGMTEGQTAFLSQLAIQLGLSLPDGTLLAAPHHFVGPSGLVCRLRLHPDAPAVRPEALLPMSAAEFMGSEVTRLLAVQGALLNEFGWYLGLSDEGLLQLSCMSWIDNACDAATAMDFANGLGIAVVRSLLHDDTLEAVQPAPA